MPEFSYTSGSEYFVCMLYSYRRQYKCQLVTLNSTCTEFSPCKKTLHEEEGVWQDISNTSTTLVFLLKTWWACCVSSATCINWICSSSCQQPNHVRPPRIKSLFRVSRPTAIFGPTVNNFFVSHSSIYMKCDTACAGHVRVLKSHDACCLCHCCGWNQQGLARRTLGSVLEVILLGIYWRWHCSSPGGWTQVLFLVPPSTTKMHH